jgi:hypothetical protein
MSIRHTFLDGMKEYEMKQPNAKMLFNILITIMVDLLMPFVL